MGAAVVTAIDDNTHLEIIFLGLGPTTSSQLTGACFVLSPGLLKGRKDGHRLVVVVVLVDRVLQLLVLLHVTTGVRAKSSSGEHRAANVFTGSEDFGPELPQLAPGVCADRQVAGPGLLDSEPAFAGDESSDGPRQNNVSGDVSPGQARHLLHTALELLLDPTTAALESECVAGCCGDVEPRLPSVVELLRVFISKNHSCPFSMYLKTQK